MIIVNVKKNISLGSIHKYRYMLDVKRLKPRQCVLLINKKEDKARLIDSEKNCYNIYLEPGYKFSVDSLSRALDLGIGINVSVKNGKWAANSKKRAAIG